MPEQQPANKNKIGTFSIGGYFPSIKSTPPLIITAPEIDESLFIIEKTLKDL
jgi:4-aminobutyrate aminotransferase-like enzyme